MKKQTIVIFSLALIAFGVLALISTVASTLFSFRIWQLWPLFVITAGALFTLPAFTAGEKRGRAYLFIPGIPLLVNGAMMLFSSVFRAWGIWSWLWPMELIGLAMGFLLAGLGARNIWLTIPASIIGMNGLLMQFCAITGWWEVWAVAWVIELLSVGLALLVCERKHRSTGLRSAGLTLLVAAGLGFAQSLAFVILTVFIPTWLLWRWSAPSILIIAGIALLYFNNRKPANRLAAE